jgi:hypothetical protein
MSQPIQATLHSYNDNSGVWAFTTGTGVPYSGTWVSGERPPVGTSGAILETGNPNGYFDFVWHPQPGNGYHQSVFKPV